MPITKTTSFPTNVVLSDVLGTPASPSSYFGFANAGGTVVASTGPRIQAGAGNPNGVLTSPIGSQWTDSASGLIYTNVDGSTTWMVSSNVTRNWFPLVTQSPLNAKSDYFNGGAVIDPKWSNWNPGASTTASQTQSSRLKLLQTTHAGNALGGIRQAVPASARYAITGAVRVQGIENNIINGGIFVAGDIVGAPTTAPVLTLDNVFNSGSRPMSCSFLDWTNYATLAAPVLEVQQGMSINVLRIFVDTVAATFSMLLSPDGYAWVKFNTTAFAATAIGAAPSYMGLSINNGASGEDAALYASMFRIDATSDPYLQCGGFA